jgi:HEAT repeat protein
MGKITLAIEQRWRLQEGIGARLYPLLFLHVLVLATTIFGIALSYTLLLGNTGPEALPRAFFSVGVVTVAVMVAAELLERLVSAGAVYLGIAVLTLIGALAVRLMLPVAWVGGSFLAFVVAESSFLLLVRRLRSLALHVFDELEWGRLQTFVLPVQACGGVIGAVLLIPFVLEGTYLGAALTWLLLLVGTIVAVAWVAKGLPPPKPTVHLPLARWRGLFRTFPILGGLVGISIWSRILRFAIQGTTLAFWGNRMPIDSLGLMISALLLANALMVVGLTLTMQRVSLRFGAGAIGLIYSAVAFVFLALWFFIPGSWTLAILISLSWTTLVPGLQLGFIRQAVVLFPRELIHSVRTLLFITCSAIGALLGGVALLFYPLPLDGRVPIGITLIGAAIAVLFAVVAARLFARQWRETLAGRGLEAGIVAQIDDAQPASAEEIESLLNSEDPESIRVGFFLAARAHDPAPYADAVEAALPRASTPACRAAALDCLGHLPSERLAQLLTSGNDQVRARALAAVARYRIPVGIAPITTSLRDESSWVQLLACAAAWRLGMAKLADVAWGGLNLADIGEEGLLEFLEIIQRGAPIETIRVLKQLAHFPLPRIRQAAMPALARALRGETAGHADLLETGIKGVMHEAPSVRAAAVDLLVASGTDNAADYLAPLLEDGSEEVRLAAARGLSQLGLAGADVAKAALNDPRPWVVEAAIYALGANRSGRDHLESFLQLRLDDFVAATQLPWSLRFGQGVWLPISTAMQNRRQRLIRYVGAALGSTGRTAAARALELLMGSLVSDVRKQLCQVFSRHAPRRWANALLPTLREPEPLPQEIDPHHPLVVAYLKRAMTQGLDPFLQVGAQMTWAAIEDEEPPELSKELPMNRLLFLKNIPYFEGLLLEELLVVDERLQQETYAAGETIFKEGATGDRFYIIWEGSVDLLRGETKIATLQKGDHFAEMAIFEDAPRSATAIAATPCTLLALQKQAFQTLVLQQPTILLHICKELSHRLRKATSSLV